jgi:nicotinamidase/pyrazinamidase
VETEARKLSSNESFPPTTDDDGVVKTVFFDVDTQLDFLSPEGALYVPGAECIVNSLCQLTRFAAANQIPIISMVDAHAENDPEFKTWKPHCVVGTTGQRKAAATLLKNPIVLRTAPRSPSSLESSMKETAQILVEKQQLDCFANPNLRPLLKRSARRTVDYSQPKLAPTLFVEVNAS